MRRYEPDCRVAFLPRDHCMVGYPLSVDGDDKWAALGPIALGVGAVMGPDSLVCGR